MILAKRDLARIAKDDTRLCNVLYQISTTLFLCEAVRTQKILHFRLGKALIAPAAGFNRNIFLPSSVRNLKRILITLSVAS